MPSGFVENSQVVPDLGATVDQLADPKRGHFGGSGAGIQCVGSTIT